MGTKYKWQQRIVDKASEATDLELLKQLLAIAHGDDYDGDFTDRGWWEYAYLRDLMIERLGGDPDGTE